MTVAQLNAVLTLKSDLSKALKSEGQSIDSFVNQARGAFKKFDDSARKPIEDLKASLRGLGQSLTTIGIGLSAALTAPLVAAGKGAFDAAVKLDSVTRSLTVIMGSASAANVELKKLFETAKLPGITFEQAVKGSQQLQAVGYTADKSRQILEDLGNTISLLGGSDEEFQRMIVNIRQVSSMSRLTGDELREMSAIVPGVAKALRQAFGTDATEDLKKMGVTGAEALDVIFKAMHQAPTADPNSIQNQIENMKNDFFQLKAAVGQALIPVFTDIANRVMPIMRELTDKFKALSPEAKRTFASIAIGAAAIGPVVLALGSLASSVGTITTLFKSMSGVFSAILPALGAAGAEGGVLAGVFEALTGPIGWVIAALTALGAAFATNFGGFRTTLQEAWKAVTDAFGVIAAEFQKFYSDNKEWIDLLGNALYQGLVVFVQEIAQILAGILRNIADTFRLVFGTLFDLFKVFKALFTGDWTGFWKGILNIQQRFSNYINQLFANFLIGALNMGKALVGAAGPFLKDMIPLFDIAIGQVERWKSNMNKAVDGNVAFTKSTKQATDAAAAFHKSVYIQPPIPQRKNAPAKGGRGRGGRPKPLEGFVPVDPGPAFDEMKKGIEEFTGIVFDSQEQFEAYTKIVEKVNAEMDKLSATGAAQEKLVKFGLTDGWDLLSDAQKNNLRFMAEWIAGAEAQKEAEKKLREAFDQTKVSLEEQVAMLGKTGEAATLEYRLTAGDLKDLNAAEKDRLRTLAATIDEYDKMSKHRELFDSARASLDESLALFGNESDKARLQYRMMAGDLKDLTQAEKDELLAKQDQLDVMKQWTDAWNEVAKALNEDFDKKAEKRKAATDRFNDLLTEQTNRILGLSKGYDALRRAELEAAFAGETDATKRKEMIDKIIDITKVADKLEEVKKLIEDVAKSLTDTFMKAFEALFKDGFQSFFDNVIDGFRQMIREIARQWLESQITSWLTGALGGILKMPAHRAAGGPVTAGDPFIVGERGPELFVPSGNGRIVSNGALAGAGGTTVAVTINVSANDASSFLRSKGQIASAMGRELRRHADRDYR